MKFPSIHLKHGLIYRACSVNLPPSLKPVCRQIFAHPSDGRWSFRDHHNCQTLTRRELVVFPPYQGHTSFIQPARLPPAETTQPQKRCGVNRLPPPASDKMSHHFDVRWSINVKKYPQKQFHSKQQEKVIFTNFPCKLFSFKIRPDECTSVQSTTRPRNSSIVLCSSSFNLWITRFAS